MNFNKLSFYAEVKDGKLSPRSTVEEMGLFVSSLEGTIKITVEQAKKFRSLDQNRLYWRILTIIADETGHTTEELHEVYKEMFLPRNTIQYGDKEISVPKSTTDLSTKEFTEYIERISAEAANIGIVVTMPGEVPLSAYITASV